MLRPGGIASSACAQGILHVTAPFRDPCLRGCCPVQAGVPRSAPDGAAVRWGHVWLLGTYMNRCTSLPRTLR